MAPCKEPVLPRNPYWVPSAVVTTRVSLLSLPPNHADLSVAMLATMSSGMTAACGGPSATALAASPRSTALPAAPPSQTPRAPVMASASTGVM